MDTDELYMHRCIEIARLGAGSVAPNPMVGAVLVCNNMIIGEGYHRLYGQPHAEVNCLRDAALRLGESPDGQTDSRLAHLLRKSTMYVSLEPCAHYGKTPPCADLIIEKGIPAVVIGCRDPFVQVDGKGIEKLLAAGVQVKTGILLRECIDLNKRFFTFHQLHRPYIILKWAQSRNCKIAAGGGERTLISNEASNRLVHKWRSEEASILVGTATALADNPALTTRLWPGNDPVRLVIDRQLKLPGNREIFGKGAKTIIFNNVMDEQRDNIVYRKIDMNKPVVTEIANALYSLQIQSVLVEGGARTLQSFADDCMWDEARIITSTTGEIAGGLDAPLLSAAELTDELAMGTDEIRYYKPARNFSQR